MQQFYPSATAFRRAFFALMMVCVATVTWPAHAVDLEVRFAEPHQPDEVLVRAWLRRSGVVADFVDVVREEFRLPRRIRLEFGSDDGPLYDPSARLIQIPYTFIIDVDARIAALSPDTPVPERDDIVAGVLEHTLYHELGHALVDVLDLRLVEAEEDGVDTLATVLMIESFVDGDLAVLDAMEDFYALDELEGGEVPLTYFAEHSLDIDRYESGLCLVYGSDPPAHPDLLEELGERRASACVSTWRSALKRWNRRLAPVLSGALLGR